MAKGSNSTTIQGLVLTAIGVLGLIIVYVVIPLVGSQMDQAVSIPGYVNGVNSTGGVLTGSAWNSTVNSDVPTAVSLWVSLAGIIKVAAFIIIIGGFMQTIRGIRG